MRRLRLYLDSSFCIALEEAPAPGQVRRTWSYEFLSRLAGRHDFLVSTEVLGEIRAGPSGERRRLERRLGRLGATVVGGGGWAGRFAQELRTAGGFGASRLPDLRHVGFAVGAGSDILVTWDARTLACEAVRRASRLACRRWERKAPLIGTPLEVMRWLHRPLPPGIPG